MSEKELKPCPFCGGNASQPENTSTGRPEWKIGCTTMFCTSIKRVTKRDAVNDWNTRPDVESLQAEVERLKGELKQEYKDGNYVIKQRDYWEDMATKLAKAVGEFVGVDVGEHSNINCPVESALEALGERHNYDQLRAALKEALKMSGVASMKMKEVFTREAVRYINRIKEIEKQFGIE